MTVELDVERLLEKEPYEIIDNSGMGQRYRLLERGSDSDGEFLRFEARYQADARQFPEHVHPRQNETVRVLTGEMVVAIAGNERTVGPGEQITLPAGDAHVHRTATGTETRALVEIRPPLEWVGYIRTLVGFAPLLVPDDEGTPNPLAFAVLLDTYPGIAYSPDLPIAVQTVFAKLLSPVGRVWGYGANDQTVQDGGSLRGEAE